MSWREDAQSTGSLGSWHRAQKPIAFRSTNGVTRIRPEPTVHNAVDSAPMRFYTGTNDRESNNETFWQAQQEHANTAYGTPAIHPLPFAGNVSSSLRHLDASHPYLVAHARPRYYPRCASTRSPHSRSSALASSGARRDQCWEP